jgi:hypothetical protein
LTSPIPPAADRSRVARAHRRPARWALVGMAALALAGGAGCKVDNTPANYDADNGIVGKNYVATCTGQAPVAASTTTSLLAESTCTCQFDVFKAGVPYNDADRSRVTGYPEDKPTFQTLENDLRKDPSKISELPADVRQKLEACQAQSQVGPVVATTSTTRGTDGSAPGTTVLSPSTTTS